MARLFDDASSEHLRNGNAVLTTYPFTMGGWAYSDDLTINQQVVGIYDASSADWWRLQMAGITSGDPVEFHSRKGGTQRTATTTSGYSANTWHHVCAVATSATDRAVFIDGGSKGTNTQGSTPANLDRTSIGVRDSSSQAAFFSGRIAEVFFIKAALSDAVVALLAEGFSPLFFQQHDLRAYWRLIRDEDQDSVGGFDMTAFNTPTVAEHMPKIIYPAQPFTGFPASAAPPAAVPSDRLLRGYGI